MMKFKKPYILKIISISIAGIFIIETASYGYVLSSQASLRVPLVISSEKGKNRLLTSVSLIDDRINEFNGSLKGKNGEKILQWYRNSMALLFEIYKKDHNKILKMLTSRIRTAFNKGEIDAKLLNNYFISIDGYSILLPIYPLLFSEIQKDYIKLPSSELPVEEKIWNLLKDKKEDKKCFIVGISGGASAGKSTEARLLKKAIERDGLKVGVISVDGYLLPREERREKNVRGLETLNTKVLSEHIELLKQGKSFRSFEYILETGNVKEGDLIEPSKFDVIIIEGVFINAISGLQQLLGANIFIDRLDSMRLKLQAHRDMEKRGYKNIGEVFWNFADVQLREFGPVVREGIRKADIVINPLFDSVWEKKSFAESKMLRKKEKAKEQMGNLKSAILDLDGVIFNNIPICRKHVALTYCEIVYDDQNPGEDRLDEGIRFYDEHILGHPSREKIPDMIEIARHKGRTFERPIEEYVEYYYKRYDKRRNEEINDLLKTNPNALLMPGFLKFLNRMKDRGIDLYIVSAGDEIRRDLIEKLGLTKYFKDIRLVSSLEEKKKAISDIIEKEGISFNEVIFIDDAPSSIIAAHSYVGNNLFIVGIPGTSKDRDKIANEVNFVINTFDDLLFEETDEVYAKDALEKEAQKLLDFLRDTRLEPELEAEAISKEDIGKYNPVILALGSPSPEAFKNAALDWVRYKKMGFENISIIASTGKGRGYENFVTMTRGFFKGTEFEDEFNLFIEEKKKMLDESEAGVIAFIMEKYGVPEGIIQLEKKSNNTYSNVIESMSLLDGIKTNYERESNYRPLKIQIVAASFHRLRALMTVIRIKQENGKSWLINAKDNEGARLKDMSKERFYKYVVQMIGDPSKEGEISEIERFNMRYNSAPSLIEAVPSKIVKDEIGIKWTPERIENLRNVFLKKYQDQKNKSITLDLEPETAVSTEFVPELLSRGTSTSL